MKITKNRLRKIIGEVLLREQSAELMGAPTVIVTPSGREMDVKIGTVEEVRAMTQNIPRASYKPDQHEVWSSKKGLPPQEQADHFFSSLTPGMPGGPKQFYWDPQTETLFAHVVLNTF